jgi:hypothetical protein
MNPSQGSISFDAARGPAPHQRTPKPIYRKNDTTAASARIAEIRETERLALKVARELITPIEEQVARFKPRFLALVEGISAQPAHPALAAPRPTERVPIAALIEPKDRDVCALAMSPAVAAIVAVCGCRWPIGEPTDETFHFCNKKRAVHFYCEAHAKKAIK